MKYGHSIDICPLTLPFYEEGQAQRVKLFLGINWVFPVIGALSTLAVLDDLFHLRYIALCTSGGG